MPCLHGATNGENMGCLIVERGRQHTVTCYAYPVEELEQIQQPCKLHKPIVPSARGNAMY